MRLRMISEADLERPGEKPIDLGLGKKEPLPEEPEDLTDEFGEAEEDLGVEDEEVGMEAGDYDVGDIDMGLDDLETEIDSLEAPMPTPVEPEAGWTDEKSTDPRDVTLKHSDGFTLRIRRLETGENKWMAQLYDNEGNVLEKGVLTAMDGNLRDIAKERADKIIATTSPKPEAPEAPMTPEGAPEKEAAGEAGGMGGLGPLGGMGGEELGAEVPEEEGEEVPEEEGTPEEEPEEATPKL